MSVTRCSVPLLFAPATTVAARRSSTICPADPRLNVSARTEKEYYERQTSSGDLVKYLGTFVAMHHGRRQLLRGNEHHVCRCRASAPKKSERCAFSVSRKFAILLSFFLESVLIAFLGGLLGILLVLPLNNMTTGIGSNLTFAEVAFQLRVTPAI